LRNRSTHVQTQLFGFKVESNQNQVLTSRSTHVQTPLFCFKVESNQNQHSTFFLVILL